MKRKKSIASICILVMIVGMLNVWLPAEESKASSALASAYVEGYKHVTITDFSMADPFTADLSTKNSYSLKDENGTAIGGNFDNVIFSTKVTWNAGDGGACPKLMLAAVGGTSSKSGFQIFPNKHGTAINIYDNYQYPLTSYQTSTTADALLGVLYASDVATALGESTFTFVDSEFVLQIGFDYYEQEVVVEEETVTQKYLDLTFYVNGVQVNVNERYTSASSTARVANLELPVTNYEGTGRTHGDIIGYKPYTSGQGTLTMASVVPTPAVIPAIVEGFQHVTTTNYGMANPFTADMSTRNSYSLKDANGNPVSGNFDKVVFSTNVTWSAGDGGACPKLMLAAVGGTSSNSGFQIYPNKNGTAINIYDNNLHPLTTYQTGSSDVLLGVIYATDVAAALGQDTFSFVDNDFVLQTSFEYSDKEVEVEGEVTTQKYLRIVFYIDGVQIRVNERLSSASSAIRVAGLNLPVQNYDTKHGNIIGYKPYASNTGTLVLTPVDISPLYEPVYLDGYKHVTLNDFSMGNEFSADLSAGNSYSLKNNNGTAVSGKLDKVLFSAKVKWNAGDGGACPKLMFAAVGGTNSNSGFQIYPNKAGTAVNIMDNYLHPLTTYQTSATADALLGVVYATDVASALGEASFSFVDNEFILQIGLDYYESTDDASQTCLEMVFYVNGEQIQINPRNTASPNATDRSETLEMIVQNYDTKHGDIIGYKPYTTSQGLLEMSSVVAENKELTPLTWSDFGIANQAILKAGYIDKCLNEEFTTIQQLGNTSFEGKITFLSGSTNDRLYIGGGARAYGLRFASSADGTQLMMLLGNYTSHDFGITTASGSDKVYYFDATTANVDSFLNNEFTLKITTEYADYDNDGLEDDVQLGIFIDGALYNNRYWYATDYTSAVDGREGKETQLLAGNRVGIYSNATATDNKGIMLRSATPGLKSVLLDLGTGAYTTCAQDFANATIVKRFDTDYTSSMNSLSVPGDYQLYNENGMVGELVLYQEGDVHPDGEMDVKDLVAILKVKANIGVDSWAGTMAALESDFDKEDIINTLIGLE